jgi:hypothetical protein
MGRALALTKRLSVGCSGGLREGVLLKKKEVRLGRILGAVEGGVEEGICTN